MWSFVHLTFGAMEPHAPTQMNALSSIIVDRQTTNRKRHKLSPLSANFRCSIAQGDSEMTIWYYTLQSHPPADQYERTVGYY